MEIALTALELLWEKEQRARRTQERSERRARLKTFAVVLVLIALTLTVATVLAAWVPREALII